MNNESIKSNLVKIRQEKNLSQAEAAEELGISRNAYRNIERGATKLISDKVMDIAEWAGMTPEEFLLGYLPVEDRDGVLKDQRDRYNERVRNLTDDYEDKISRLMEENLTLKERLKDKEESIRIMTSWIALLEKKVAAQEAAEAPDAVTAEKKL